MKTYCVSNVNELCALRLIFRLPVNCYLSSMAAVFKTPSPAEMSVEELKLLMFNYSGECSICFESHVNPKVLPCLHPLCASCIDKLCADKRLGMSFTCPECRRKIIISCQGNAAFADLFSLRRPLNYNVMTPVAQRRSREGSASLSGVTHVMYK
jgi:predicted RNA-binding Zn-ribbon protein involved in translation (DUF1610 family)